MAEIPPSANPIPSAAKAPSLSGGNSLMATTLLSRMIGISLAVMAMFCLQAFVPGVTWNSRLIHFCILILLALLKWAQRRSIPGVEHAFLGLVLGAITLFDDGFHGRDNTWILHIPFALAVRMVSPGLVGRRVWHVLQALVVGLVNFTELTPHLDRLTTPQSSSLHFYVNLFAAVAATILIVDHYGRVTEQALQQAQQDRQAAMASAQARVDFLSHMSHELRTPLNAMQGFAELGLQDSGLDGHLQENLRAIKLSAEHLTHLVNDILDLAKLESGSLHLQRQGFSPLACLDEIRTLLSPLAREKGLQLEFDIPSIPRILGDRTRCKQILINLASNAIKYTTTGRVTIRSGWKEIGEEIEIWVEIQDTGPGIPPSEQELVFDRFHRTNESHSQPGTGLGLAISRSLARAMGGDITLCSQIGQGSTFCLRLQATAAGIDQGDQTRILVSVPRTLSGLRVLLAEDNRTNIRLATQVLSRLEATYDVAEDGGKALEFLRQNRYDLILLDIHMPVLDGFQVAQAVRAPDSGVLGRDTPILALTADAFEETKAKTKLAGMDDLLTKPFRIGELSERILDLVGRRTSPRLIGSPHSSRNPAGGAS